MSNGDFMDQDLLNEGCFARSVAFWREIAPKMAAFEAIGRAGISAVLKIDGVRNHGAIYTVVVSGPGLGENYFHQDSADLDALLVAAIGFYEGLRSSNS